MTSTHVSSQSFIKAWASASSAEAPSVFPDFQLDRAFNSRIFLGASLAEFQRSSKGFPIHEAPENVDLFGFIWIGKAQASIECDFLFA